MIAGLLPIEEIAALANAGTLVAFAAVAICMMVLRRRAPDMPRMFRTPLWWLVGAIAVVALLGLLVIFNLQNSEVIQVRFLVWHLEMSRAVLLFLVLARYLPCPVELKRVILLQAAMPAAVFPIVIGKVYGGDTATAAANWGSCGTKTASCSTSRIPSTTLST